MKNLILEYTKLKRERNVKTLSKDNIITLYEQFSDKGKYLEGAQVIADYLEVSLKKIDVVKGVAPWDEEKISRAVFTMMLKRGDKSYIFPFYQSIVDSGREKLKRGTTVDCNIHKAITPSFYGIISSLEKYDVGSFEDFCSDFDYNSDSKKIEELYTSVRKEYEAMQRLFNEDELELLSYIQ